MLTNFYLYNDDPSQLPEASETNSFTSRPNIEQAIHSAYCRVTNTINATRLKQKLFPQDGVNTVFLSHAHKDETKAQQLQNFLAKRGVNSFIDSDCWACLYEVFNKYIFPAYYKQIVGDFCYEMLDTPARNSAIPTAQHLADLVNEAAHYHLMLADALTQVMLNCDTFILVLPTNGYLTKRGELITPSAWINHELSIAKLVHDTIAQQGMIKESAYHYTSDISHLNVISNDDLFNIYPELPLV